MALTPEDIKNKQFTTTRGFGEGYVETEVDDFLDEVYEEFARLIAAQSNGHGSTADLDGAAEAAPEPIRPAAAVVTQQSATPPQMAGPSPASPPAMAQPEMTGAKSPIEAATGILALAQRTADDYLAAAQADAEERLAAAHAEADQVLGDAHRQADELTRQLEDQRRDRLGNLEAEQSTLERTIESLRTFEREYRSRLRAYLDAQLHELDAALSPEPDAARRFLLDEGSSA
jgi:DivIVA domain-containing protein